MKKHFLTLFFLSTFLLLGTTNSAWAEPCSSPDFCTTLSECESTSTGACSEAGQICCSKRKTTPTKDPSTPTTPSSGSGIQVPTGTGLPSGDIMSVLTKTLDWIEGIFLALALIAFVIVGIMFLFSLGNANSGAHTNAKTYFNQAVTALLIVGSSYILIKTINYLLQG